VAQWKPLYAWVVTSLWIVAIACRVWPLGAPAMDYDEGVYWASLRAEAMGHPLFSSVFSSQPPLFLDGLYPFYILFGQSFEAARAAVALYSLLGVAAIWLAAWALGGRWCGALALALLAFEPRYLTESYTLQAEAPALAFASAPPPAAPLGRAPGRLPPPPMPGQARRRGGPDAALPAPASAACWRRLAARGRRGPAR
jgi:hypothetical protein